MKSIEKSLMFAMAAMALVSAVMVTAISTADQAQATGTKAYKFSIKLYNGNKHIGQEVKVSVKLYDTSGKVVGSASKLVTIKGNSVTVPITVNAPINVKVDFARACVQIANVASNVVCARDSTVSDLNTLSVDIGKLYIHNIGSSNR
jgi:hypothetical protein